MEIIVASAVGVLTAGGVYLLLRLRTFPVILGLALLSYAVNVFLFASGRLSIDMSPILSPYGAGGYTDPLPQALVLTAIVIGFGTTALLLTVALRAYQVAGHDDVAAFGDNLARNPDAPDGQHADPEHLSPDMPEADHGDVAELERLRAVLR